MLTINHSEEVADDEIIDLPAAEVRDEAQDDKEWHKIRHESVANDSKV